MFQNDSNKSHVGQLHIRATLISIRGSGLRPLVWAFTHTKLLQGGPRLSRPSGFNRSTPKIACVNPDLGTPQTDLYPCS